jgi:hypothetical protein
MKALMISIFCFFSSLCHAQCENSNLFDVSFFNQHLLQEKDTLYYIGTYISLGKVSQRDLLKKLSSKKIIDKALYSSAIEFLPLGSDSSLYLPYKDIDKEIFSRLSNPKNSNKTICIKAIIIQGYEKLNNRPFFLIDRVWLE